MQPTASLLSRAIRKLQLTTKMAGKGYYKGTRSGNVGQFSYKPNRYYMYEVDKAKVRTFVRPTGLEDSMLTPFVAKRVKAPKKEKDGEDELTAEKVLKLFKEDPSSDIQ